MAPFYGWGNHLRGHFPQKPTEPTAVSHQLQDLSLDRAPASTLWITKLYGQQSVRSSDEENKSLPMGGTQHLEMLEIGKHMSPARDATSEILC